jgi:hypothetical protein
MKTKIIVVLMAALVSLVSVGCSTDSFNPASSTPISGEATAKVTVTMNEIGSLGKVAANTAPVMVVFYASMPSRPVGSPDPVPDTILVSGSNVTAYIPGFQRGQTYNLSATAYNSDGVWLNEGTLLNVLVGDVDTFSVDMTLKAGQENIKVRVPIKGTPVEAKACSMAVKWSSEHLSTPPVVKVVRFSPGTMDTVLVDELMALAGNYTNYVVEVTIYLNDGSYYKGSGAITLYPSTNASLTIPLTKYGGASSLAKMVITISALGRLDVSVSFS